MFEFDNITKKFQTSFWESSLPVLDQLSFKVKEQSLTGFLGTNGSGKTTSIKILLRLIAPDRGKIIFSHQKKQHFEKILSKIGYVTERPYYYPYLKGREFLCYMGQLSCVEKNILESRIEKYAHRLSIDFALERKIATYSKGMLQRLGIVACLLHNPDLLILDEPTSGMDPIGRKEIKDLLVELHHEGKTIFFSSHIIADVEEICSDLVIIDRGKLIYEGTCRSLLEKYATEDYLAVMEQDYASLGVFAHRIRRPGSGKIQYYFDAKNRENFLKACVDCKAVPVKFERSMPTLEKIVYKMSSS
ncbi:MAG: ABC transporter ATP-binding protein [Bacteriovoracales bacterium]|nr:ABC transporter ATP-binding protein [Bacteriovoracales bacterium]